MTDKKATMIYLLIYLWRYSDPEHPVTNEDINKFMIKNAKTELDRKTIPKHVSALNDCFEKLDMDLFIEPTKKSRKNAYYLSGKPFVPEQVSEIIMAITQSKSVSHTNSKEFSEKLLEQLSVYEAEICRVAPSTVIRGRNIVHYVISKVNEAIEKGCRIKIEYKKDKYAKGKGNIRTISPYFLRNMDNAMYLVGKCHEHDPEEKSANFRLDRINDIKVLDQEADLIYKQQVSQDQEEYNKNMTFGKNITLMLEFDSLASTVIYDRYGEIPVQETDFGYRINQSDILNDELLSKLFMIYDHIKIIGPEELKNAFRKKVKSINDSFDAL